MKISELARTTGVSVPTLKYYLREGLMPSGESLGATQASYGEGHVTRVRLVRALLTGAGLSVARARRVVAALDEPPTSWHELLGAAQGAIGTTPTSPAECARDAPEPTPQADALLDRLGWRVEATSPARHELETALGHLAAGGLSLEEGALEGYAAAMSEVARLDVGSVPTDSPEAALRQVVLGTLLLEPALMALRRLAQEDGSARRFGSG